MADIGFTKDDWARLKCDNALWWEGKLDRPLIVMPGVTGDGKPRKAKGFHGFLSSFPPSVSAEEIVEKFAAYESQKVYLGDTYPMWFINFGPGILSGPLGARVTPTEETVWFDPPEGANITKLRIQVDRYNYWWQRILAVTKAAVDAIGDRVQISHTDLGGNLDILAGLIGSEPLCMELIDHPEEVRKAVSDITAAWIEAYEEIYAIIHKRCPGTNPWLSVWATGKTYSLQCDFSYMISPEMFARFVMPDLVACCDHLDYGFYHLDGIGELPHLDQLLSIKRLRGIQWVHGDGKPTAEHWPDLYRRIRAAGKLIHVSVSREGAKKICREVGGKGFTFSVNEDMSAKEAEKFLDEMRKSV